MNHDSLHAWLKSACPARADMLLKELQTGHRSLPDAYAGLPTNAVQLSEALRALEVSGRVERRGNDWHWREPAKVEPQKALF